MGLKEKLTKTIAVVSENLIMGEDILSVLKRDHRKVTELFAEIEDTSDGELRKELFNTLKTELSIHAVTEEKLFYSRLKKDAKEKISHAFDEHDEIRNYLEMLSDLNLAPDTNQWLVILKNLKNTVNHHVLEEETKIFQKAKTILSEEELLEIGLKFTEKKNEALKRHG
jgi:hemerythrin superfamily protein